MADSLVLKGVKDVVKHKGSEMLLTRPKRGGDTHQLKKWWLTKAVSTVYVTCSVFKVTGAAGVVYLALDTQEKSQVRIDHDGNLGFSFYGIKGIERGALYNEDMKLIEHYVFPKISGGKVMTVTPSSGADRPTVFTAPPAPPLPTPTTTERAANADITHVVTVGTAYGKERYYIDGARQAEVTSNVGQTIYFDLSDASLAGHPFAIYTDDAKTTTVSVGVETSDDGNILLFTPPIAGSFSYQCTQHDGMGGDITVS